MTTSPPVRSTVSHPTVASLVQSPPLTRTWGRSKEIKFEGSGLIKYRDIIDTPETGKDLRPLLFGENRPVGTFQAPNRSVAVDSNDQDISKGLGFFQITDMSDMEKVETAVGEDDPFPLCLQVLDDPPEVFSFLDLFLSSSSPIQNLPDLTQGVNPSTPSINAGLWCPEAGLTLKRGFTPAPKGGAWRSRMGQSFGRARFFLTGIFLHGNSILKIY